MTVVSLRAALNKATPGPWEAWSGGDETVQANGVELGMCDELIVAAVNALPALLDVAEAAQALLAHRGMQGAHAVVPNRALREALAALDKEQT